MYQSNINRTTHSLQHIINFYFKLLDKRNDTVYFSYTYVIIFFIMTENCIINHTIKLHVYISYIHLYITATS